MSESLLVADKSPARSDGAPLLSPGTRRPSMPRTPLLAFVVLLAVGLGTWWFAHLNGYDLSYRDARSHLNIARLVTDSRQPGLSQLGSVWLPLGHMLMLPLIWIDWAWRTGFAGALVSAVAYGLSVISVGGIVKVLGGRWQAALAGALVMAGNPDLLYMQTTALTEPLFIALLSASVYFLVRFARSANDTYLVVASVLVALQVLTRYEGWFVAGAMTAVVFLGGPGFDDLTLQKRVGRAVLFASPAAFAAVVWVAWNALIFGDPLYFLFGPYSASAQQQVIQEAGQLATKGDLALSTYTYGASVTRIIGPWLLPVAAAGWAIKHWRTTPRSRRALAMASVSLASPGVFSVLSLTLGVSVMNVPRSSDPISDATVFNVRYGLLLLPMAAVGVGLLIDAMGSRRGEHARSFVLSPAVLFTAAVALILSRVITDTQERPNYVD